MNGHPAEFIPEDVLLAIDEDGRQCAASGKPAYGYEFTRALTIDEIEMALIYLRGTRKP